MPREKSIITVRRSHPLSLKMTPSSKNCRFQSPPKWQVKMLKEELQRHEDQEKKLQSATDELQEGHASVKKSIETIMTMTLTDDDTFPNDQFY